MLTFILFCMVVYLGSKSDDLMSRLEKVEKSLTHLESVIKSVDNSVDK